MQVGASKRHSDRGCKASETTLEVKQKRWTWIFLVQWRKVGRRAGTFLRRLERVGSQNTNRTGSSLTEEFPVSSIMLPLTESSRVPHGR